MNTASGCYLKMGMTLLEYYNLICELIVNEVCVNLKGAPNVKSLMMWLQQIIPSSLSQPILKVGLILMIHVRCQRYESVLILFDNCQLLDHIWPVQTLT